ncbi:MAG: hypothetical protein ACK56F_25840, partial [bacterium]
TPSLVFLSTLADSHFQQKMEEKGYKKPGHFQYHNQLLWVQAQNIINILPPPRRIEQKHSVSSTGKSRERTDYRSD